MRKFLVATVLLYIAPATATEQWLKEQDITYVFVGREVSGVYANGASFSEIYRRNGDIEYSDETRRLTGKWSQNEDQFCSEYKSDPGGCYRIKMHGDNCFEYWLVQKPDKLDTNWIARSWRAKYPSTCPASQSE